MHFINLQIAPNCPKSLSATPTHGILSTPWEKWYSIFHTRVLTENPRDQDKSFPIGELVNLNAQIPVEVMICEFKGKKTTSVHYSMQWWVQKGWRRGSVMSFFPTRWPCGFLCFIFGCFTEYEWNRLFCFWRRHLPCDGKFHWNYQCCLIFLENYKNVDY